jgi:hypothetical protein
VDLTKVQSTSTATGLFMPPMSRTMETGKTIWVKVSTAPLFTRFANRESPRTARRNPCRFSVDSTDRAQTENFHGAWSGG